MAGGRPEVAVEGHDERLAGPAARREVRALEVDGGGARHREAPPVVHSVKFAESAK